MQLLSFELNVGVHGTKSGLRQFLRLQYCANSGRQSEGIEEDGEELDLISKLEDMNLSKEPGRYSWVPSDI